MERVSERKRDTHRAKERAKDICIQNPRGIGDVKLNDIQSFIYNPKIKVFKINYLPICNTLIFKLIQFEEDPFMVDREAILMLLLFSGP